MSTALKTIVLTGASSGIGRCTAEFLAAKGWRTVLSGVVEEEGKAVTAAIQEAGGKADWITCDVSKENDVKKLVETTYNKYGKIDGAMLGAGIFTDHGPVHEQKTQEFRRMFDVNLMGVFHGLKYFLPVMMEQNEGTIIAISSIAGIKGLRGTASYNATKWGVVGLVKTAADEYAQYNIRVNAVAPGAISTEMLKEGVRRGWYDDMASMDHPLGRLGQPLNIARAIDFLLENDYATGTILNIDGGLAL